MESSQTNSREPLVSFQGKEKCVNIGRDTIRLLGEPNYVSLLISEDGKNLAISPCEERNPLSFMVPKDFLTADKVQFRIHSKLFVDGVLRSAGLDTEKTYRVRGKYFPEHNVVQFALSDFHGLAKDRIIVI